MTTLISTSKWDDAERPGLYRAWEGYAWVELHRHLVGRTQLSSSVLEDIEQRLEARMNTAPAPFSSGLAGEAGPLLIADLAHRVSPQRFEGFIPRALNRAKQSVKRTLPSLIPDFVSGVSGAMVAASALRNRIYDQDWIDAGYASLRDNAPRFLDDENTELGLAHGIAGLMLALEIGRSVFGVKDLDDLIFQCQKRIFKGAFIDRDGHVRFGRRSAQVDGHSASRWCVGNLSIAFSATRCHAYHSHTNYKRLVEGAWAQIHPGPNHLPHLCCGDIGRAHVLLSLTGASALPHQANFDALFDTVLCDARKQPASSPAGGLFRGDLGRLYLEERIACRHLPFVMDGEN